MTHWGRDCTDKGRARYKFRVLYDACSVFNIPRFDLLTDACGRGNFWIRKKKLWIQEYPNTCWRCLRRPRSHPTTETKTSLKKWMLTALNFMTLILSRLIRQMLSNCLTSLPPLCIASSCRSEATLIRILEHKIVGKLKFCDPRRCLDYNTSAKQDIIVVW